MRGTPNLDALDDRYADTDETGLQRLTRYVQGCSHNTEEDGTPRHADKIISDIVFKQRLSEMVLAAQGGALQNMRHNIMYFLGGKGASTPLHVDVTQGMNVAFGLANGHCRLKVGACGSEV